MKGFFDGIEALDASKINVEEIEKEYEGFNYNPGWDDIILDGVEKFCKSHDLKYSFRMSPHVDVFPYYGEPRYICISADVEEEIIQSLRDYLGPKITVETFRV